MESCPVHREAPEGFSLSEVELRLATPEEHPPWGALMDENHYLGFRRPASRGLRYAATFGDRWLDLAAWQNGAFKCAPRDRWAGWKPAQQFRRLEMVANNTRFLVLSEPGVFPNLASRFLAGMTRRLSDDWREAHGHGVLLAETFCDPEALAGTMYRAAGWEGLGETKGFARANGRYTDPHGRPKEIFVTALRPDARALFSSPQPMPPDVAPPAGPGLAPRDPEAMRSLHAELAAVPDFRRAQGRKHTVASVLTVHVLAEIANMKGCLAAAQFARAVPGGAGGRRRVAEPEDGASRAGLQVHPPPGRPVGRPRGAGGRGRPLVPASPRPGARHREPLKKGLDDAGKGERDCTETVYLITSLLAGAASPEELLRLNRGRWPPARSATAWKCPVRPVR